jgi:hypothetical protein
MAPASSLPTPEHFYDYTSMVEAMFHEDPISLNMALQLHPKAMRHYVKRYHREHVLDSTGTPDVRQRYLAMLQERFTATAAPGFSFSPN